MTSLSFDTTRIEALISAGSYKKAADQIFEIIKVENDLEALYECLSLLDQFCDKTPEIALDVVTNISHLINSTDSWIRLVVLETFYQIVIYRPNLLIELMGKIKARVYDQDPAVRRISVKIIGTLILSLLFTLSIMDFRNF